MMSFQSQTEQSYSFFLEGPSRLPILDDWVESYLMSGNRFTFSEAEVLASLWAIGEDIRLREDIRFCEITLPILFSSSSPLTTKRWHLCNHTVANQEIYDLLMNVSWDGHGLYAYLHQMEQNAPVEIFYVYCADDNRFQLTLDESGCYHLSLDTEDENIDLSPELQTALGQLVPRLLSTFANGNHAPWTTGVILEHLKQICEEPGLLDSVSLMALENWLSQCEDWARVGLDTWFPRQTLPTPPHRHRYGVLPVFTPQQNNTSMPTLYNQEPEEKQSIQTIDRNDQFYQEQKKSYIRWKYTLRTVHLNEGYIPVPRKAHIYYPRMRNLSHILFIPGMWTYDASRMTIWLDTRTHRLFGDDFYQQIALLEVGTILEIGLGEQGLAFWINEVDQSVAEEEERLVDLTELAHTRTTLLENYRKSLYTIMAQETEKRWHFSTLYNELTDRQQHKPNRSTIKTILSTSPEFLYEKESSTWRLNTNIAVQKEQHHLRRVVLYAQHATSQQEPHAEPPVLTEMISRHQQVLTHLRTLYKRKSK